MQAIKKHSWFKAICLNDKPIGSITLKKGNEQYNLKAELGYAVSRNYWGKGIATKAVKEALKTGFSDLSIIRIEAYVDIPNLASIKVLEKNHFQREGLLRQFATVCNQLEDFYVYSFLKTDK